MAEKNNVAMEKGAPGSEPAKNALVPPVDIWEDADGVTLYADMPGVSRDGLNLSIDRDTLQILGRRSPSSGECAQGAYAEMPVRDFSRAFTIGEELDREAISASMANGVLKIRLPRAARSKPRRIDIRTG